MKTLTASEVKEILLANEAENAVNIDEINWHIRNAEVKADYYDNGTCLIIVSAFRGENFVKIIPTSTDFRPDTIFEYVSANHADASITIDVQKLGDDVRQQTEALFSSRYTYFKTYTDYVLTVKTTPSVDPAVRLLDENNRDAFVNMEFVRENYRPTQEILFDSYVVKKVENGAILAYFDGSTILGYLVYYKATDRYYDVDYIWVAPSKRHRGIGKKLTEAYIAEITAKNATPIWSNPKNKISAHLAESHGFRLNRITLYYKAKTE